MKCRYCGNDAEFVPNEVVYKGKRYGKSYMIWLCEDCDAYVGVHHNDPDQPLGENLANKELRKQKMVVKNMFIWRFMGDWDCTRKQKAWAYQRLSEITGIPVEECHFGNFELDQLLDIKEKIRPFPPLNKK